MKNSVEQYENISALRKKSYDDLEKKYDNLKIKKKKL